MNLVKPAMFNGQVGSKLQNIQFSEANQKKNEQLCLFKAPEDASSLDEEAVKSKKTEASPVVIECGTMGENSELIDRPKEFIPAPTPSFLHKLQFAINFAANFLSGVAAFLNDILSTFKTHLTKETLDNEALAGNKKRFDGYL